MRNGPVADRPPVGVFVGLATLDVVHRITTAPAVNQKITSTAQFVAAGGPAANAAVTFAGLGGEAVLVTALGDDPVADLIRADLTAFGVTVVDAATGTTRSVPVSAVSVLDATGERSVVSLDAVNSDAAPPDGLRDLVDAADVVLVDGHHPLIGVAAARLADECGVAVVVDAGRWKPVMAELATYATDMVCSDDFRLPDTGTSESSAAGLVAAGVRTVVTTHGSDPVRWWSGGVSGSVDAPRIDAVDTLGAGDVFHGAYAYFSTRVESSLEHRIERAAHVAALRCSVVGPRSWLEHLPTPHPRKRPQ